MQAWLLDSLHYGNKKGAWTSDHTFHTPFRNYTIIDAAFLLPLCHFETMLLPSPALSYPLLSLWYILHQPQRFKRFVQAVFHHRRAHQVCDLLQGGASVGHTDAGFRSLQHLQIVHTVSHRNGICPGNTQIFA